MKWPMLTRRGVTYSTELAELRDRVVAVLRDTEVPAAPLRGDLEFGAMRYLFS